MSTLGDEIRETNQLNTDMLLRWAGAADSLLRELRIAVRVLENDPSLAVGYLDTMRTAIVDAENFAL